MFRQNKFLSPKEFSVEIGEIFGNFYGLLQVRVS